MKQSSLLSAFKLQKAPKKSSEATTVAKAEVATENKLADKSSPQVTAKETPPSLPTATTKASNDTKAQPEVGQYLRVYWPDDDAWYEGCVKKYTKAGKAVVKYDDGDTEELDLEKEKYELVTRSKKTADKSGKKARLQKAPKKGANASAAVEEGLEDSDVEAASASEGSEYGAMDEDDASAEDEDMHVDESEEEGSDAAAVSDSDDDILVPRKRPAKSSQKTPTANKKAKKSASGPEQQSPSENINTGNGAVMHTPTVSGKPAAASGALSAGNLREATPRTGQLFGRLSCGTPAAADLAPGDEPGASHRFAQRYKEKKFSFMWPENLRDKQKNKPKDDNYDASTCYFPADWFKTNKISDGQQQWWTFKGDNWDSVLLFKMGKFYELFEMDAFVGVDCLGLQFMKGDQPHAGFPEAAYFTMAEKLARAGHRVVVVEQTETPDQLKAFNDSAQKGSKRKVVQRQAVTVLTQGTLTDPCMTSDSPHATYAATVVEELVEGDSDKTMIGICMVDTAASTLLLGQFEDSKMRSQTLKYFTELNVSEVLVPKGAATLLQSATKSMLKGLLPDARFALQPATCWDSKHALQALKQDSLFSQPLPDHLAELQSSPDDHSASLSAMSGMVSYLQRSLLDKAVLSVGTVVPLDMRRHSTAPPAGEAASQGSQGEDSSLQQSVALDASALSNLNVLDCEGGVAGSVLAQLDHCVTPGGKRTLRAWLAAPLQSPTAISLRQDAVEELLGAAADAADTARTSMRGCGDIERAVVRLAAAAAGALGRDAPGVVLYEDTSRRKVKAVTTLLSGLQSVETAFEALQAAGGSSEELKTLCSWGKGIPDFREPLKELLDATDWKQALQDGRVTPKAGIDSAFDEAVESKSQAEAALTEYLEEFREKVGVPRNSSKVRYVSVHKDSHVLEVPEDIAKRVPNSFNACAGKKGVKRFLSDDLQDLNSRYNETLLGTEAAQNSILSRITATSIGDKRDIWLEVSRASGRLDALLSLAVAAQAGHDSGPMCRPKVTLEHPSGGTDNPFFQAKALRNATQIKLSGAGAFVPNDVDLGVSDAPFMLLTGPNTGGKSTLMRQVCTATLLAQVGAWLPAESVTMSPVDAVFVRMGAKDHIMMGQSTFLVELSETAAMLNAATSRSLVALDELGRGTATMDGVAVASAVLNHVVKRIGCRGVFATHYHVLADSWSHEQNQVSVKHMSCEVEKKPDDPVPKVVNKYLLADGSCPKSYGPTVARAAGVPVSVTKRAAEISELFEQGSLPVEQQQVGPLEGCGEGFKQRFKEAWAACNNSSPPGLTCLQELQAKIATLECVSMQ